MVARTLAESLGHVRTADASALLAELDVQLTELDRRCQELLDQARFRNPVSTQSTPVDLALVTRRLVEDILSYLAEEKTMEIHLSLVSAMVAMPETAQDMIIENLLQNALKFGEPGTIIHVTLEVDRGKAHLCVINRGPSVPWNQLEKIFERGMTTGGHGLGLYTVRTVARLHGGDVVALPEEKGFRCLVTLPVVESI